MTAEELATTVLDRLQEIAQRFAAGRTSYSEMEAEVDGLIVRYFPGRPR